MLDVTCIQSCYNSSLGVLYETGMEYLVDEIDFEKRGLLKYFRPKTEVPPKRKGNPKSKVKELGQGYAEVVEEDAEEK